METYSKCYQKITDDNPYETPMMIYPAIHYTMGGLWVDYNLMTTIEGCFCIGEANFSDHGANRLGASALMQGLADGYFILPYTISNYLANDIRTGKIDENLDEFIQAENNFKEKLNKILNTKKTKTVNEIHKKLGKIIWDNVGMSRNEKGLKKAIDEIKLIKKDFFENVNVNDQKNFNMELIKAIRLIDFIELGELMALDALNREESCGGHFREEFQTKENEALRNDDDFSFVSAWEYNENDISKEKLHKEKLTFETEKPKQRNYK